MMCEIIGSLNLPLSTADTLPAAFKLMFPDSKIAKDMQCGRRKATAILTDLASIHKDELAKRMRTGPFTISTDGSSDQASKQFLLVIRSIDSTTGLVHSELLSIPICNGSATGENICILMNEELSNRGIPWSNCLSLGCDNASVMTGCKKGVIAFVKEKQPEIFLSGCTLHLIHIAAKKAAEALPSSVEELLVDVVFFFDKSEKRKSEFKRTQELFDVDQKRMLKHGCTRWLSIGRCLERLLLNWVPLKAYFKEQYDQQEAKKSTRFSTSKPIKPLPSVSKPKTKPVESLSDSKPKPVKPQSD